MQKDVILESSYSGEAPLDILGTINSDPVNFQITISGHGVCWPATIGTVLITGVDVDANGQTENITAIYRMIGFSILEFCDGAPVIIRPYDSTPMAAFGPFVAKQKEIAQ